MAVIYYSGGETGAINGTTGNPDGWGQDVITDEPYYSQAVNFVTSPVAVGSKAIQLYYHKDWPGYGANNLIKTELKRPGGNNLEFNNEYWLGVAIYIPDDANHRALANLDLQNNRCLSFHDVDGPAGPGLLMNQGRFRIGFGQYSTQDIGPVIFGRWFTLVYHVGIYANSNGFARIWLDAKSDEETPVYERQGAYTYAMNPRIGGYKGADWGTATHFRYTYDEYRIGDANSSFYEVLPRIPAVGQRNGILFTGIVKDGYVGITSSLGDDEWREELPDPPVWGAKWGQSSTVHVREGTHSMRFRWDAGDPLRAGRVRSELTTPGKYRLLNGNTHWIGFSVFFEDNTAIQNYINNDRINQSVVQFHHIDISPSSQLMSRDGQWEFAFGDLGKKFCGNIVLGKWTDFVLQVEVKENPNGFAKLWIDGNLVYNRGYQIDGRTTIRTGLVGYNPKIGIYYGDEDFVDPGVSYIEFYIDAYRLGDETSDYTSVFPGSASTPEYYVDPVSGSNADDGLTEGTAWATPAFAFTQVGPGDTIYLMDGAKHTNWGDMNGTSVASGTAALPITVTAAPGHSPVVGNIGAIEIDNVDYWIIDGITFNNVGQIKAGENSRVNPCDNWIWRNCRHEHSHNGGAGSGYHLLRAANNWVIENCEYDNIRTRYLDKDKFAILIGSVVDNLTVNNCSFIDIGGDGIQSGDSSGLTNSTITNCHFEVIRPYQYRAPITGNPEPDPGISLDGNGNTITAKPCINVGENGIDLKQGTNVLIENCTFRGFRPCPNNGNDPGFAYYQDGSGSRGNAVTLQQGTSGTIIRKCLFDDNHIGVGSLGGNMAECSNCIFIDTIDSGDTFRLNPADPTSIELGGGNGVKIEHNTFYTQYPNGVAHVILAGATTNLRFRNNVVDNALIVVNTTPTTPVIDYNAYANLPAPRPSVFRGANDVDTTDMQIAYEADYYPSSQSDVIGNGADLGYASDYYGNPITNFDIGAVQYIGAENKAIIVQEVWLDESVQTITLEGNFQQTGKRVWIVQGNYTVEQPITYEDDTTVTITVDYGGRLSAGLAELFVGDPV